MISEAIDKILGLAAPTVEEIDGRMYVDKSLHAIKAPKPAKIGLNTLSSLAEWVQTEGVNFAPLFVSVDTHTQCSVFGMIKGPWMERDHYVEANAVLGHSFDFGHYFSVEEFIIGAQTKFVPSPDRNRLLQLLSVICAKKITTAEDDGISQTLTVKNEMSGRPEEVAFNPIIRLRPYRTFLEVEQPESDFLVRFRNSGDQLPTVALYEADGGLWKEQAQTAILDYLHTALGAEEGITVIR